MPAEVGQHITCRVCGREVVFLRHERTMGLAPIEVEPRKNGRFIVNLEAGTYATHFGMVAPGVVLHENHYVSCPQAQLWRTRSEMRATRKKEAPSK